MNVVRNIGVMESLEIRRILIASNRKDLADLLDRKKPTDEEIGYCTLAQELADEDLEFDEQPFVSVNEDGAFVSAWVWIPAPCENGEVA